MLSKNTPILRKLFKDLVVESNWGHQHKYLAVAVGDGMSDAGMAAGDEDVLRFRIFDPRPGEEVNLDLVRQKTFTRFDGMIESGDFAPAPTRPDDYSLI